MTAILIQARLSSARFPGKMLSIIGGMPLVQFVYQRCKTSALADTVAVITSDNKSDDPLVNYCNSSGIMVFRGPLDNVLLRYILAAEHYGSESICRVCGDSPFVDIGLIDRMWKLNGRKRFDYIAPDKNTCIAGLDSEIISSSALKKSLDMHVNNEELEHVTLIIRNRVNDFNSLILPVDLKPEALKGVHLTVDYPQDLIICNTILDRITAGFAFTSKDILNLFMTDSCLRNSNKNSSDTGGDARW